MLGDEHKDDPPTSGAQNGYHGNTRCLTTGPQNLHFMTAYFKNYKVYKIEIRHILLQFVW